MSAVERLDLRAIAPQPWKNGCGLTREIASGGDSAESFDWRLSVAEVARDAPFSAFPGIDRCIVLLAGHGLRLRSRDRRVDHALGTPLAPFRFAGDAALDATLIDGACSDFNVMTRRGRWRSDVDVHREAAALVAADIALVLCIAGRWRIDGAVIDAPQGLLWRAPRSGLTARTDDTDAAAPPRAGAALLHVRLCHDPAP